MGKHNNSRVKYSLQDRLKGAVVNTELKNRLLDTRGLKNKKTVLPSLKNPIAFETRGQRSRHTIQLSFETYSSNPSVDKKYLSTIERLPNEVIQLENAQKSINKALSGLETKIGTIDKHKYPAASTKATEMLEALKKARDAYLVSEDTNAYKDDCKKAIDTAMPTLEKDIGWGDYLKNLLKVVVNTVIKVATIGKYGKFFETVRSESAKAVEDAKGEFDLGGDEKSAGTNAP